MLRRPPISIQLRLEDISEYEEMRQQSKDNKPKSFELPSWQTGIKPKQEIYARIGYVPPGQQTPRPTNFM